MQTRKLRAHILVTELVIWGYRAAQNKQLKRQCMASVRNSIRTTIIFGWRFEEVGHELANQQNLRNTHQNRKWQRRSFHCKINFSFRNCISHLLTYFYWKEFHNLSVEFLSVKEIIWFQLKFPNLFFAKKI